MNAGKIAAALRSAAKDENVAAIVFRVDSPGGEPAAAEAIRRAVVEAKEKGKPVVVSMGGMAASGGYWISAPADKIVAEPATITGSIGIFGGKMVLEDLWGKLGVNWDGVSFGENAMMWSSNQSFTPKMRARLEHVLDSIYAGFRVRVAEGRKMSPEAVMAVAEGRVFTGRQAKENGLVDELGGLDHAVEVAKRLANLDPGLDVPVERFPPQRAPFEMFLKMATDGASIGLIDPGVDTVMGRFGADLNVLTLPPEATLLRLPYLEVRP